MKVIIEIPEDTQFIDIICKNIEFDIKDQSITMNTNYEMVNVNDLEKIEEKQEPLGDFEDDWSIKNEHNGN